MRSGVVEGVGGALAGAVDEHGERVAAGPAGAGDDFLDDPGNVRRALGRAAFRHGGPRGGRPRNGRGGARAISEVVGGGGENGSVVSGLRAEGERGGSAVRFIGGELDRGIGDDGIARDGEGREAQAHGLISQRAVGHEFEVGAVERHDSGGGLLGVARAAADGGRGII